MKKIILGTILGIFLLSGCKGEKKSEEMSLFCVDNVVYMKLYHGAVVYINPKTLKPEHCDQYKKEHKNVKFEY
jgi:hypothetical protein